MKLNKNILYIGNQLANKGNNVTSIETLGKLLEQEGFQMKFSSSKKNQLVRLMHMCFAVVKYRKWTDYILIDTYSTSAFWYAYFTGYLASLFQISIIPILRGGDLPKRLKKSPMYCKPLFSYAYCNIAPSAYLFEVFQNNGFTNVKYIPNSIQIENYPFQHRKEAQPKLLYVRSFAHIYNPMMALHVLKELLVHYPTAELSMVGPFKDDSIQECKAFAHQHKLPVVFTGKMEKEEWIALAKDFDIFVNTTNVDNTPISVIEAMALGLPVVSTNVGGIPYLLEEDEAILVSPNNVDAMKNAIIHLIENPTKVAQLSQNARTKAESFDWQNVKFKWIDLLK